MKVRRELAAILRSQSQQTYIILSKYSGALQTETIKIVFKDLLVLQQLNVAIKKSLDRLKELKIKMHQIILILLCFEYPTKADSTYLIHSNR